MSIVNSSLGANEPGDIELPAKGQPLHRLGVVRHAQAVSRRTVARQLDIDVSEVRRQEEESNDLLLSQLYQWQRVLDVPLAELLIESGDALSLPPGVAQRAQLVRLMKTTLALSGRANEDGVRLMAQTLVDQLVEIMPELRDVLAWHTVGTRRGSHELGSAAERTLPGDACMDLD